jgi:hypothetical protein
MPKGLCTNSRKNEQKEEAIKTKATGIGRKKSSSEIGYIGVSFDQ